MPPRWDADLSEFSRDFYRKEFLPGTMYDLCYDLWNLSRLQTCNLENSGLNPARKWCMVTAGPYGQFGSIVGHKIRFRRNLLRVRDVVSGNIPFVPGNLSRTGPQFYLWDNHDNIDLKWKIRQIK